MEKIELYVQDITENLQGAQESFEDLRTSSVSTAQAVALLEKRLLVLRLSFGKVKAALLRFIAPFANLLLPVISRTMVSLAAFVNRMAKVVTALFGGGEAGQAMAESQTDLSKSIKSTAKELARFDTLDRIGQLSGSTADATVTLPRPEDRLTPALQAVVGRIRKLLLPLQSIDLSNLTRAFQALREALEPFKQSLFAGLEWAWTNLFVPLARWTTENLLPTFLRLLASAMNVLGAACSALMPFVSWLWEEFLRPLAVWTGQQIIGALQTVTQKLQEFARCIGENQGGIVGFVSTLDGFSQPTWNLATAMHTLAERIRTLLEPLKSIDLSGLIHGFWNLTAALQPIGRELFAGLEWAWHNLLVPLARWTAEDALPAFLNLLASALQTVSAVCQVLKPLGQWLWNNFLKPLAEWTGGTIVSVMGSISEKLQGISGWVEQNKGKISSFSGILETLSGAWDTLARGVKGAWEWLHPKEDFFSRLNKNTVNSLISMLNGMLSAISTGVNALVRSINKLSFTVPSWVPQLGGKKFGFNLSTVSFPKIPYLAQGAVLPANKPFLAVVGDQKNGTNIEAPLATIQQALAEVLAKQGMQEITVQFAGDLAQLGRVLHPVIRQEDRRTGMSLAKGVAV